MAEYTLKSTAKQVDDAVEAASREATAEANGLMSAADKQKLDTRESQLWEVGDYLQLVNNTLSAIVGSGEEEAIIIYRPDWIYQGQFYNFGTLVVGGSYNLSMIAPQANALYHCDVVKFYAGDIITIHTKGGNNARAYTLFDVDYVAKEISSPLLDITTTPYIKTVDYDGWLVVQSDSSFNSNYSVSKASANAKKGLQEYLRSGVNIKEINGQSILGEGNLIINSSSNNIVYTLKPFATGASFLASLYNHWFETAIKTLGTTGHNAGVSGNRIKDTAIKMFNGQLFTGTTWEDTDCLLIMHTHNYNVADYSTIKENLADYTLDDFDNNNSSKSWDYVIRKYTELRVADNKPVNIIVCTHWHDSRTLYNDSIRILRDKFGFTLLEFDKNIGFSKNATLEDGTQMSVRYAVDTEIIDGVTYGFHPNRDDESYIQDKMAKLLVDTLIKI